MPTQRKSTSDLNKCQLKSDCATIYWATIQRREQGARVHTQSPHSHGSQFQLNFYRPAAEVQTACGAAKQTSAGKVQSWSQRLFETLQSINDDFDILLSRTPYASDEFLKNLLARTLARNASRRSSANELKQLISKEFKDLEYSKKCVITSKGAQFEILDYNLPGTIEILEEASRFPKDGIKLQDVQNLANAINVMIRLFPGYPKVHMAVINFCLAQHLITQDSTPAENLRQNFLEAANKLLGPQAPAGSAFTLWQSFRDLQKLPAPLREKLGFFMSALSDAFDQLTRTKGFIILGQTVVDQKTGNKDTELIPLLYKPDYFDSLVALSVEDYSGFRFEKSIPVENIRCRDGKYEVECADAQALPKKFVIIPTAYSSPSVSLDRLGGSKVVCGIYSTLNGIVNLSLEFSSKVRILRKDHMLATGLEQIVRFAPDTGFVLCLKTNIDPNESLFVSFQRV